MLYKEILALGFDVPREPSLLKPPLFLVFNLASTQAEWKHSATTKLNGVWEGWVWSSKPYLSVLLGGLIPEACDGRVLHLLKQRLLLKWQR
jgi:hypothetical protein